MTVTSGVTSKSLAIPPGFKHQILQTSRLESHLLKDETSYNTSKLGNITKGRLLEIPVKAILHELCYDIEEHYINTGGLDVVASNGRESITAECLNWYGGYIHPKRFLSLTNNLANPSKYKFLFCAGVYPTQEQVRLLNAMNVRIIHYPKQILCVSNKIINYLRSRLLGVITTGVQPDRKYDFGFVLDKIINKKTKPGRLRMLRLRCFLKCQRIWNRIWFYCTTFYERFHKLVNNFKEVIKW